jgi:hypothetical protein
VAGPRLDQRADTGAVGGIESSQHFVKRAQHLLGKRGGDSRLGVAAFFQQRGQSPFVRICEKAHRVQQELEPAQYGAAGNGRECADQPEVSPRGA